MEMRRMYGLRGWGLRGQRTCSGRRRTGAAGRVDRTGEVFVWKKRKKKGRREMGAYRK